MQQIIHEKLFKLGEIAKQINGGTLTRQIQGDYEYILLELNNILAKFEYDFLIEKKNLIEKKEKTFLKLRPEQKSDTATEKKVNEELSNEINTNKNYEIVLGEYERKYKGYVKYSKYISDYMFDEVQAVKRCE